MLIKSQWKTMWGRKLMQSHQTSRIPIYSILQTIMYDHLLFD